MSFKLSAFGRPQAAAPATGPPPTVITVPPPKEVVTNDPYDLEPGDVIIIDGAPYIITATSALYYVYANLAGNGEAANSLTAGTARTDNISDLQPNNDEFYYVDSIGIDGPVTVQPYYPQGIPRQTPKNINQYFDETQAPKGDPLYVGFWVTPGTFPQLGLSMPAHSVSTYSDVWFYGLKFKYNQATQDDVNAAVSEGHRVIIVQRSYQ